MEQIVEVTEALAHMEGGHPEFKLPEEIPIPPEEMRDGKENKIKLTKVELAERRMQMAALFAQGKYLKTIAAKFGISVTHVSRNLNELVAEYQAAAMESMGKKIAQEEHLIYLVQLEAVQAWFESKQGKVTNTSKRAEEIRSIGKKMGAGRKGQFLAPRVVSSRINDHLDGIFGPEDGAEAEAGELGIENPQLAEEIVRHDKTRRKEDSPGDPRFLQIILDCSDRRAKLHGLYPGSDGKGGGRNLNDDDIEAMTPQQRLGRLRNHLDKARQVRAQQLALKSASPIETVEAINRKPLKVDIFRKRAEEMHPEPKPVVPTTEPNPMDLDALWNAN